jgi:hypothetical protein
MAAHPTNSIEDLINALFLDLEAKDLENRSATGKSYLLAYKNTARLY